MNPDSLWSDLRPIQSITTIGGDGRRWRVGDLGITKIEPYSENGQGAKVPWLAIYKGDSIAIRVNCAAVEFIRYDI